MGAIGDVIVVGAGVIGCAIAHELASRGVAVRLFDTRSIGGGATQASAGVLAPLVEVHEQGALLDMARRSLALYDGFVERVQRDSGLDIEFRRCGTLEVAADDARAAELRARAAAAEPRSVEWCSQEQVAVLEPLLSATSRGGLLVRNHGYVVPSALTEALAWAAMRHGAQVETHRTIARIVPEAEAVRAIAEDGATWSAGAVVLATGSWTDRLAIGRTPQAHVHPIRGQLLRLAWHGPRPQHIVWGERCYVVPWLDGTVLVGATMEDVGFDERTTAAGVRDLLEAVCELLPQAWTATFLQARVGLRPATPDGLPILGSTPAAPGVIYATGHFRNGILLAPLTALLIADLVTRSTADPVLEALSPSRFAS
ncbi:MAG TPA: glycine oxidase ThiO [Vicinamibacterales bacterium]|nr:glycine oxidase ThiO [Vicinamibacterales bacterium]